MKKQLTEIIISAVIFIIALILKTELWYIEAALFLAAWFVVGRKVLWKAVRNIARGQIFDEDFLMTIASVGAFIIGEYPEAVAVMLFFSVGEMLEKAAVRKSRESIAELMDIRPDYANLKTENGIHVILEIEVQGYKQVKEKMPEAVSIFIVPPSMEELERRLRNRGTDDEETIIKRLTIAKSELLVSEEYDYIVVNDEVDRAAREIISIIDKEQESI